MNNFREFLHKLSAIGGETSINCSEFIEFSGAKGIFILDINLGSEIGKVILNYDALGIPDRFQIEYDGNIVADSLYVGNNFTGNPPDLASGFVGNTYNNIPEYYYNGTQFIANGNTQNLTISQSDVAPFGSEAGAGFIKFQKTLISPSLMTVRVFAPLGGTFWTLESECPTNVRTILLGTSSVSSSWTPSQPTGNSGSPLVWDVTGGIVDNQVADTPIFDFSGNVGIADISVTDTINVTTLSLNFLDIKYIDVTEATNLVSLEFLTNNVSVLDVTNNINLTTLSFNDNSISSIDISNNISLTTLSCVANSLTDLDISNNTNITTLNCNINSLSSTALDNILIQLDIHGLSGGTVVMDIGRTAASDAAKTSLQGKGWTVTEI